MGSAKSRVQVSLTESAIDVNELVGAVADPSAGAVDVFIGATRKESGRGEVIALEYETYGEMAEEMMEEICRSAIAKWNVTAAAVRHRLGRVAVGEISIVIAVSSPHRNEAFGACREIIDRIKKDVPIWKKEVTAGGVEWVGEKPGRRPGV